MSGVYALKIEGEGQYDLVAGPHTGLPPPSASIATHHAGAAQIEGEAGPHKIKSRCNHIGSIVQCREQRMSLIFTRARSGDCSDASSVLTASAVNSTDKLNRTPLHIAAWMGHAPLVTLLIEAGANVHAFAMDHVTPLAFAAGKGHGAVIEALLAAGGATGIDQKGGKKRLTALQLAAKAGHSEAVAMLLAAGADALIRSKKGETAYDMTKPGDYTTRDVLREGGGFSRNKRKREERRGMGGEAVAEMSALPAKAARVAAAATAAGPEAAAAGSSAGGPAAAPSTGGAAAAAPAAAPAAVAPALPAAAAAAPAAAVPAAAVPAAAPAAPPTG